jgi:hypothetical protein
MEGPEFGVKEWFRDARGYRLESEEGLDLMADARKAASEWIGLPEALDQYFYSEGEGAPAPPPLRIVRNGGSLIAYQPSNSLNEILLELLNTPATPEGARDFVNRFGPLTTHGFENDGEHVAATMNTIKWLNIVADEWLAREDTDAIGQLFGPDGFSLSGVVDATIIYDQPKKTPQTIITFKHLATLLWAYLFKILMSDDVVLRRCAQCNNLFSAGVGTGRRGDAKFCSDEHRSLFHNLKRSPRG